MSVPKNKESYELKKDSKYSNLSEYINNNAKSNIRSRGLNEGQIGNLNIQNINAKFFVKKTPTTKPTKVGGAFNSTLNNFMTGVIKKKEVRDNYEIVLNNTTNHSVFSTKTEVHSTNHSNSSKSKSKVGSTVGSKLSKPREGSIVYSRKNISNIDDDFEEEIERECMNKLGRNIQLKKKHLILNSTEGQDLSMCLGNQRQNNPNNVSLNTQLKPSSNFSSPKYSKLIQAMKSQIDEMKENSRVTMNNQEDLGKQPSSKQNRKPNFTPSTQLSPTNKKIQQQFSTEPANEKNPSFLDDIMNNDRNSNIFNLKEKEKEVNINYINVVNANLNFDKGSIRQQNNSNLNKKEVNKTAFNTVEIGDDLFFKDQRYIELKNKFEKLQNDLNGFHKENVNLKKVVEIQKKYIKIQEETFYQKQKEMLSSKHQNQNLDLLENTKQIFLKQNNELKLTILKILYQVQLFEREETKRENEYEKYFVQILTENEYLRKISEKITFRSAPIEDCLLDGEITNKKLNLHKRNETKILSNTINSVNRSQVEEDIYRAASNHEVKKKGKDIFQYKINLKKNKNNGLCYIKNKIV